MNEVNYRDISVEWSGDIPVKLYLFEDAAPLDITNVLPSLAYTGLQTWGLPAADEVELNAVLPVGHITWPDDLAVVINNQKLSTEQSHTLVWAGILDSLKSALN